MSYRRFRISDVSLTSATVATVATVAVRTPKSVATVAAVAAPDMHRTVLLAGYRRMFEMAGQASSAQAVRIVERFLDYHVDEALRLGWSEIDLFGCYPAPSLATIRYDCMGAVTIAALTRMEIKSVSEAVIRSENGLACRRPLSCATAKPVWLVFPEPH